MDTLAALQKIFLLLQFEGVHIHIHGLVHQALDMGQIFSPAIGIGIHVVEVILLLLGLAIGLPGKEAEHVGVGHGPSVLGIAEFPREILVHLLGAPVGSHIGQGLFRLLLLGLLGLHGPGGREGSGGGGDGGHRSAVDVLSGGGHSPLPVGPGLQGLVVEKAPSGHLSPGLAHHMTQLVAQQSLAGAGGKIQRARRKADLVAHGHSLGPGLSYRLALIELHAAQIGPKGGLHLAADCLGQVHLVPQLFRRGHGTPPKLFQTGALGLGRTRRQSRFPTAAGPIYLRCHDDTSSFSPPSWQDNSRAQLCSS